MPKTGIFRKTPPLAIIDYQKNLAMPLIHSGIGLKLRSRKVFCTYFKKLGKFACGTLVKK